MINCRNRKVLNNGNALKVTIPQLWAQHTGVKPGDVLTARWNEKTGELILSKVTA